MTAPARVYTGARAGGRLPAAVRANPKLIGGRHFNIPGCSSCGRLLHDHRGQPFWDFIDGRFVCVGGCRGWAPARRARRR
jgi:hypothetical protein